MALLEVWVHLRHTFICAYEMQNTKSLVYLGHLFPWIVCDSTPHGWVVLAQKGWHCLQMTHEQESCRVSDYKTYGLKIGIKKSQNWTYLQFVLLGVWLQCKSSTLFMLADWTLTKGLSVYVVLIKQVFGKVLSCLIRLVLISELIMTKRCY